VHGDGIQPLHMQRVQFSAQQATCINGRRQSPIKKLFLPIHGKLH
jgi:hypothetical protein